ncbi:MAG TPA: nuclear transport factor 2 family protein [Gemmatimonadaceae bacterium]|nr:nuclear transport factor 2 family protein [Gemmatimonadaceae bacterium]
MRHRARPSASLLLLALAIPGCGQPVDPAGDAAAIRAVIARTEAMNNAGDVEGWVALFEPGAVYMPPGQPAVTTVERLREAGRAGFTSWKSAIRIEPEEIVTSGDWGFARSTVRGTATPVAGGDAIRIDVKQLVVYHRQAGGEWRIARLITNSNGS